ncbi:MAG: class I SAM-dependent methyltransferase [Desulfobacteraceae bacterium]|nr:class I SAM-dependent methyltransferase [Desulfobacteraceae bacterium]
MYRNTKKIKTGTTYQAHLLMALKLLEIPPDVLGDVVECGTWKGGSAANLSIVCKIVGRKLRIFDSFEGLPNGHPEDRMARHASTGLFCGAIDEVRSNISRYGEIDVCEFNKGWYQDTLPGIEGPIVLSFLDVDYEASLDICIRSVWPHLVSNGYIFIDEYLELNYCSLFFSEKYWDKYFKRKPPGLIGAGSGLPLGSYYIGPFRGLGTLSPLERPTGPAYTRKDFYSSWEFYPDESEVTP